LPKSCSGFANYATQTTLPCGSSTERNLLNNSEKLTLTETTSSPSDNVVRAVMTGVLPGAADRD